MDNDPTFKVYLSTEVLSSAEEVKFQTVKTHFMKMSSKNCRWSITSIEFVTNVDLQKKFYNKKAEFQMKTIPDEELFAYHGTQPKNVKNICKTNLNIIRRTAHGGEQFKLRIFKSCTSHTLSQKATNYFLLNKYPLNETIKNCLVR